MSGVVCPPGPKSRGVLGNLPMTQPDPLGVFTAWAREYGGIFHYRALHRHIYFLSDPELIRQVLLTDYQKYIKGEALRFNRRVFGNGLITSEGRVWLEQRRLIQPGFHRDRTAVYGRAMVAHAERRLGGWRDGDVCDIYREMMELTLEIVTEALFAVTLKSQRERFGAAVNTMLEMSSGVRMMMPPLLRLIPTPGNMRYLRAVRKLDGIVYGLIRARRKARGQGEGDDLLSALLAVRYEDGAPMPEEQVRDEVMTLLLAGHETTAVTLAWTWYLLAQHPDAEAKLWAELAEVLDGRTPEPADMGRLPYAERVIKESMRLYPAVWALVRTATEECEVGGYRVPTGSSVVMSQWVTHRDARFFEDPERFDPDRWVSERAGTLPKFAYFPFGGGPRSCIGAAFSMMEMVLVLATMAQRFRIRLVPGSRVELLPTITLRPLHGIQVVLEERGRA